MENLKKKESFVFYRSFADTITDLPDKLQLPLFKAISAYALDLKEPSFDDFSEGYILKAIWHNIKPQLDANHRRYLNALNGGAPKGSRNNPNGRRGKTNRELTENLPNENENENENENVDVDVDVEGNGEHYPPTLQDVSSYFSSIGSTISPDKFYDHYTAIGWVDKNGNPIKDWKCVARIWQGREKPKEKPRIGKSALDMYDAPKRCYTIKEIMYAQEHGISDAEAYDILHGIKKL